jgi:UDP-glucose 4-epimerase
VFQRSLASEQRRIFGGPLARPVFFDTKRVPVLPVPRGLRFQAVHSGDVAAAVVAAVERPVRGAVNLAGPGLLRRHEVARLFGARTVEVPSAVIRSALATGFLSRLAPAPPELYDALIRSYGLSES